MSVYWIEANSIASAGKYSIARNVKKRLWLCSVVPYFVEFNNLTSLNFIYKKCGIIKKTRIDFELLNTVIYTNVVKLPSKNLQMYTVW